MTVGIPAPLTRAAWVDVRTGLLTREAILFLDALRNALGGDTARVTPNDAVGALAPVGMAMTAAAPLWPVSVPQGAADLAPVAACAMADGLAPVSIPMGASLP
jgi:hypothetical protein